MRWLPTGPSDWAAVLGESMKRVSGVVVRTELSWVCAHRSSDSPKCGCGRHPALRC